MDNRFESVSEIARFVDVSDSCIYRWIQTGKIVAKKENGKFIISIEDNRDFIFERYRENRNRPIEAWVPDGLEDYSEWHQVIDYFCWLIKLSYSSRENLKKKSFRLDSLFASYI